MTNAHILAPDVPDTSLSLLSSLSIFSRSRKRKEKERGKREGRKFLTQAKSPSLNFPFALSL